MNDCSERGRPSLLGTAEEQLQDAGCLLPVLHRRLADVPDDASHDASSEAIERMLAKNIAISTPLAPPEQVPRTGVGDETYADLFTDAGHRRPRARFRAHGAGRRFLAEVIRPAGIHRAGDP